MSGNDAQNRNGPGNRSSDDDLSARLRDLETRLEHRRAESKPDSVADSTSSEGRVSPLGQAMRLSSEFIAGVVVGGGLGFLFDYVAGTKPWGLMAFLMLGLAAGLYNVMRSSGFIERPSRKKGQDEA